MRLADEYGWDDYESPGGGCLLTEEHFSKRIEEFVAHDRLTVEEIDLLKFGRHFRLPDGAKLAVGRDKEDNEGLETIKSDKYLALRLPIGGPFSLLSKNATQSDKALAAKIAITYTRSSPNSMYAITVGQEIVNVSPFEDKKEAQQYFFNA